MRHSSIADIVSVAHPLTGAPADFEPLLERAADRRLVLIGEASHGTHEFYRIRAEITKRLIEQHGFSAVAIEGDWPDAYRVNRYVHGLGDDADAEDALAGFVRFPQWMWRNADVLDFVGWLRAFNETQRAERAVGFYGLDLYSLHASIEAVVRYLRSIDPEAALRAARRYACFDRFGPDPQAYGYGTMMELQPSCENEVLRQLVELRANAAGYARRDGRLAVDDLFSAEQNATVVADAEQYYRVMYRGGVQSWNLRDRHMTATLDALAKYLESTGVSGKVVVWAHNSHLGDARATETSGRGELNVGQLVRQEYGDRSLLVGFTTYAGTVTAASDWSAPVERKRVRNALPQSFEALFHDVGLPRFYLDLQHDTTVRELLDEPRLERAIGVIYRPDTERLSHYLLARLSRQFDAILHYDRTRAVEPLEDEPTWQAGEIEVPETYPSTL